MRPPASSPVANVRGEDLDPAVVAQIHVVPFQQADIADAKRRGRNALPRDSRVEHNRFAVLLEKAVPSRPQRITIPLLDEHRRVVVFARHIFSRNIVALLRNNAVQCPP